VTRADLVSGLWAGHYEQAGRRYPQQMTLEFADGLVRGDGVDDIGTFTLEGEYRVEGSDVRLGWVKTYDEGHSVLYLGEISRGSIIGRWSLTFGRGTFALAPARRLDAQEGSA